MDLLLLILSAPHAFSKVLGIVECLSVIFNHFSFLQVSGSLLLSSSVGQGGSDVSESEDSLAFEQEVVKLMETNVTTAMQYLQNKGLCLMPIALATAISNQKGFSTAIPPDRRKPITIHGMAPLSHSSMDRNCNKNDVTGCNGTIVKQEARESNDKTRELDHEAK